MAKLAVIGGTGAAMFPNPDDVETTVVEVAWGAISAPVRSWRLYGHEILFLARHGDRGDIPPHKVNYRANLQALKDLGADWVLAINAVGGIAAIAAPGQLVVPDQLIDYTWGREHTYFEGAGKEIKFIDFTVPYDDELRRKIVSAAVDRDLQVLDGATYGVTQGPRLETAAEIDRLERDGCHIVGMTAMPEAALARELGLPYASCCIVVNWAAGRSAAAIHAEIDVFLNDGMAQASAVVDAIACAL
jgi:5'-deoxy-5'-methylthioadenosine phosphorylase